MQTALFAGLQFHTPTAPLCWKGTYTFRQHSDYGTGAFVGVDGATVQAATWGHLNLDPQSLAAGEPTRLPSERLHGLMCMVRLL